MTYPDNSVLVACELPPTGEVPGFLAELCGAASAIGTPVVLLIASTEVNQETTDAVAQAGAEHIAIVEVDKPSLGAAIDAVEKAAGEVFPIATLCLADADGSDLAGRASVRLKQALLADVTGIDRDDEGIIAYHSVFGGSYRVTSAATFGSPVITVRRGAVDQRAEAGAGHVVKIDLAANTHVAEITDSSVIEQTSTRPALISAKTVVSGGRAFGSKEGFESVEKLADALGAGVGASRAAVDAGYVDHAAQVGQTGVSIQPDVYFALGISGAMQHLAGMQTAKHIIAVNKDAEAPIIGISDFGVVGDIFDVIPQLTTLLEQRKG